MGRRFKLGWASHRDDHFRHVGTHRRSRNRHFCAGGEWQWHGHLVGKHLRDGRRRCHRNLESRHGTLELSGANSFSGVTSVSQGILQIGSSAALGASGSGHGTVVASGATLQLSSVAGFVVGNESLTLEGTGVGGTGALRNAASDNAWSGPITLAGNTTVQVDAATSLTLNGSLVESGGARTFTKTGTGLLVVAGNATTTGTIFIETGILRTGSSERIGDVTGLSISAGATFDLDDNVETFGSLAGAGSVVLGIDTGGDLTTGGDDTSTTFSGVISGLGAFTKAGTGTMTLTGGNTYDGSTTLAGGILSVASLANGGIASGLGMSSNVAANLVFDGGTLRYTGATQTLDRSFTIDIGSGTIEASGTGALTLAGTTLLAGLDIARTFTLAGNSTAANTLSGALSDSGTGKTSLTKSGAGLWILGGANTYTGETTITAGTLRLSGNDRLSDLSAVQVSAGATVDFAGKSDTIGSLAGAGNVTLGTGGALTTGADNSTVVFSGVISGAGNVTMVGSGTQQLTGANTYSGVTTISGGTLSVSFLANGAASSGIGSSTNAAANLVLSGGTLKYTGGTQSTDRNFTIGTSGGTFDASGSGAVTFTGTATLATNNAARSLTLTGTNSANNSLSGILADSGSGKTSLVKSGSGTWVLSAANTYTGTTSILAGTLIVNGIQTGSGVVTVSSGASLQGIGTLGGTTSIAGTHAPGSAGNGLQKFSGGLQYQSGSIFEWSLDATTSGRGVGYDAVNVSTSLSGTDAVLKIVLKGSQALSDSFWNQSRTWTDVFMNGTGANLAWTSVFSRPIEVYNAGGKLTPVEGAFTLSGPSTLSWTTWTAVPEPGNLAAGLLVAGGFFRRRRD